MHTTDLHRRPPPSDPPVDGRRETAFRALFADVYEDVLKFAQRRVHPSHAEDVVAEAFLVAWRRFDDAPGQLPDQRAWLYGITRNCVLNSRRGQERQSALAVRLGDQSIGGLSAPGVVGLGAIVGDDQEFAAARIDLARAWQRLSAADQEVISLSAIEGLTSPEAARVLGTTSAAYRLRLMRARRSLRAALAAPSPHVLTQMETTHEHA